MSLLQTTLTWSKGSVRGLDQPVPNKAPSPPQRGSKASLDSTCGMRSVQPALPTPHLQPKEAASTKYPGEDRKPIPKNLNWGSQLKFRPAEHGFDRDFKLHHLRTDKWTKPFGLKSPQQFQHEGNILC